MRKIRNPFVNEPGYFCFGCCPTNPHGMHMEFWQDGADVLAYWQPLEHFQGWGDILHGGVQTALVDELGSWAVILTCQKAGVTFKLEMRFIKPISIKEERLTIRARVKETKRNIVIVESEILDSQNAKCTEGLLYYYAFSAETAPGNVPLPQMDALLEPESLA